MNLDIQQFEDDIIELELIGEGPCILRGKDISTFNKAEILNPDCEIAHLEENATLSMTLYVRMNKGYVTAEENQSRELPVNVIYLDSSHSPIKRVNYNISTQTVDEQEQDQLNMEIWTSGAVNPIDSVAYAAKIMKEHMEVFINFDPEKRIEPDEDLDVEEAPTNDNLYRSVSELELSVRSINCLQNAKIEAIADLVQKTEAEMLRTKNFGRKSLNEIKTILSAMNLSLGMKLENFDPDANLVEKSKERVIDHATLESWKKAWSFLITPPSNDAQHGDFNPRKWGSHLYPSPSQRGSCALRENDYLCQTW
jgi:DNA-directed RNA polymerase subunit alpha